MALPLISGETIGGAFGIRPRSTASIRKHEASMVAAVSIAVAAVAEEAPRFLVGPGAGPQLDHPPPHSDQQLAPLLPQSGLLRRLQPTVVKRREGPAPSRLIEPAHPDLSVFAALSGPVSA
jgi:hypothetical protein